MPCRPFPFRAIAAAAFASAVAGAAGCTPAPQAAEIAEIAVTGNDYAFQLPDSLPAGRTAFSFRNEGQVPHEMIFVALREGASLAEVVERERSGGDWRELVEPSAAILIAEPATEAGGRILVDLERGRSYALVCNFRDGPDAPPHTELGMLKSFDVY